jgi:hypothetical protein
VKVGLLVDMGCCRNSHTEKREQEQQTDNDLFAGNPFWRSGEHSGDFSFP